MTSLPVLHLKATSPQNAVITDDPYETTATLYTFLRSVPSVAEKEVAFQTFMEALHAAPSSGRSALMRKPNHRTVQLLETVAVDSVFRHSPQTIPALARHSDRWVRRLGYGDGGARRSPPSPEQLPGPMGAASASGSGQPSPPRPPPPSMPQVVRAAEMHQFDDPYAAYEAQHGQRAEGANGEVGAEGRHDVRSGAGQGDGVAEGHLQYSGSTQAPDSPTGEHAVQPHRSHLFAEVSALTASESDAHEHDGRSGSDDRAGPHGGSADGIHPVLELIARQVEQAVTPLPEAGLSSPSTTTTALDELVKSKILRLTSRLDDAAEEVSAAMHEREAAEQVWSPYYSRLKTSMSFVEGLQQRLGSAISLYQLQRYERETLQQACVAVQMEALGLRLVLRDVRARLADAEETADPSVRHCIEDDALIERLRGVLSPQAGATAAE
ncbi:hypothetical protein ABB37_01438 [Leptomonas pyrrhocoris]|uniref:Uncharacterized protein n=1 Tax=Leptomonas pyrrhocoris TaxID=157538 RepID=A0A0M9G8R1_LEPPY|nr:hypothetical protein ABB37_01438 [Leptomonas pyrrhocoris]KPA85007.1 hypothetical protein ABB37_01438 [Leptomonas pyrrhocoris]|eukprot:XP_015663446.1 hypothetical protein ABB37_01438 [Leptomonas pyrrhocoris]